MILVIYVLNKVKYKILFKSWKKNTFKPYKPLLPKPWNKAFLSKCGWQKSHLAALPAWYFWSKCTHAYCYTEIYI